MAFVHILVYCDVWFTRCFLCLDRYVTIELYRHGLIQHMCHAFSRRSGINGTVTCHTSTFHHAPALLMSISAAALDSMCGISRSPTRQFRKGFLKRRFGCRRFVFISIRVSTTCMTHVRTWIASAFAAPFQVDHSEILVEQACKDNWKTWHPDRDRDCTAWAEQHKVGSF